MITRYRDVDETHRACVREILESLELYVEKNRIPQDEYNHIRSVVKSRFTRLSNTWNRFFATVVDAKFQKKVNEVGEKEETYLDGKSIK